MEQVLTKALAFVAVIALGYFLKKRGFFKPHDYELIAKIVLNITLPCAVITSFAAFKMDYNSLKYYTAMCRYYQLCSF